MLDVLGEAALRTLLLAAVVGCSLRLLRVRHPQLLLAAWTVVLVASISMPMLARLAPLRVPAITVFPIMLIDDARDTLTSATAPVGATEMLVEEQPRRSLRWWLETGYVVVAAAITFRVLLGVALSLRLRARSVPISAEWIGGMRVRISRDVGTPVTVARTILLPADAEGWSAETRTAVLAHEKAHVARWDFAMLVLAQLNRALFWFSPLSWWLYRRLVILSELASDDQTLAITRDPLGYAEILLEMSRRSGPVLRGPAMARLSTLAARVDRILDEPAYQRDDPLLRAMTAAVVAGLSVAAASLVPDTVPDGGIASVTRLIAADVVALAPQLEAEAGPNEPSIKTERAPALKEAPTATLRSPDAESVTNPSSQGPDIQQGASPSLTVSSQQPRLGLRPSLPSSSKAVTYSTPARAPKLLTQDSGPRPMDNERPRFQPVEARASPPLRALDSDARIWNSSRADNEPRLPLPYQVTPATASSPRYLGFDDIMQSTCTGTIAIGLRARQIGQPTAQPNVIAGQIVIAKAQFFRREGGASWVRFFAFERPPLDVPVKFTQGRVTWTGEYGISYAVQPSGGDHLVGLAAQVAADSAQLEFTCRKSSV